MTNIFINPASLYSRAGKNQRDPESTVVGKIGVSEFSMLTKRLPMVSCQYDESIFHQVFVFQVIKHFP